MEALEACDVVDIKGAVHTSPPEDRSEIDPIKI